MGLSNHFWLAKCREAARTMEDNEAEGAFFFFLEGGVWNIKGPVNEEFNFAVVHGVFLGFHDAQSSNKGGA